MALSDLFNNENFKHIDSSIERKLEMIGVGIEAKVVLENTPCMNILEEQEEEFEIKVINPRDLIGYNRPDMYHFKNWLECLENTRHIRTFKLAEDRKIFNKILTDPAIINNLGIPLVAEKEGKYYIGCDGKHRLIMAKIMGMPSALVKAFIIK